MKTSIFRAFTITSVLATAFLSTGDVEAGALGGPRYATGAVGPRRFLDYNVPFYGDQAATVTVRGDGSTDLDCYAYDSYGNLVDSDTDETDYCVLRWWTPRRDVFTVRVVNHSTYESNYFVLRTN